MVDQKRRPLIPSCSLCSHFNSLRGICSITGENKEVFDTKSATQCQGEGRFVRYINVIPNSYNIFGIDEEIPMYQPNLSRFPHDAKGLPLVVKTNRGLERALPAFDGLSLRVDPLFGEVPAIFTYQGQRELIHRLGIHLAKRLAEREGVRLIVLPEEENAEGCSEHIHDFMEQERIRETIRNCSRERRDW